MIGSLTSRKGFLDGLGQLGIGEQRGDLLIHPIAEYLQGRHVADHFLSRFRQCFFLAGEIFVGHLTDCFEPRSPLC